MFKNNIVSYSDFISNFIDHKLVIAKPSYNLEILKKMDDLDDLNISSFLGFFWLFSEMTAGTVGRRHQATLSYHRL